MIAPQLAIILRSAVLSALRVNLLRTPARAYASSPRGTQQRPPPMADQAELAVQAAQEAVTKQADTVRSLKAEVKEGKIAKVARRGWLLGGR